MALNFLQKNMKPTIYITRSALQRQRYAELMLFGSCTEDWGTKSIIKTSARNRLIPTPRIQHHEKRKLC